SAAFWARVRGRSLTTALDNFCFASRCTRLRMRADARVPLPCGWTDAMTAVSRTQRNLSSLICPARLQQAAFGQFLNLICRDIPMKRPNDIDLFPPGGDRRVREGGKRNNTTG